jgi:uncharacterized coiled-coil DUF342 family protein
MAGRGSQNLGASVFAYGPAPKQDDKTILEKMQQNAERMNATIRKLHNTVISNQDEISKLKTKLVFQENNINELKSNIKQINVNGYAGGSKKRARGTVRKKKNIKKK